MNSALKLFLCLYCLRLDKSASSPARPSLVHHDSPSPNQSPHPTKGQNEHEVIFFFYDRVEHNMVIRVEGDCYVAALTAGERMQVHTDAGLQALELKLLAQVAVATPISRAALSPHTLNLCGKTPTGLYTVP